MLTSRELATVLAALRFWQQQLEREGLGLADDFPKFDDEEPLSVDEIDDRCDRLNEPVSAATSVAALNALLALPTEPHRACLGG